MELLDTPLSIPSFPHLSYSIFRYRRKENKPFLLFYAIYFVTRSRMLFLAGYESHLSTTSVLPSRPQSGFDGMPKSNGFFLPEPERAYSRTVRADSRASMNVLASSYFTIIPTHGNTVHNRFFHLICTSKQGILEQLLL